MSDSNRLTNFAQIITYRLVPDAPFQDVIRQNRIYHKLSKEPGFEHLYWGRWEEDRSRLDILIGWKEEIVDDLPTRTLRILSPLNDYLCPDSQPTLLTLDSSNWHLSPKGTDDSDGRQVSITTFKIPETACAADPDIEKRFRDVAWALGWGLGRLGDSYGTPVERELLLSQTQKIESAATSWFSAWVVGEHPTPSSSEKHGHDIPPCRRRIAFMHWERPEFETTFKARRSRHTSVGLKCKDIRGIDEYRTSAEASLQEEKEGKDPLIATQGFWKPITETWGATFEEHHVSFHESTPSSYEASSSSWLSCSIQ